MGDTEYAARVTAPVSLLVLTLTNDQAPCASGTQIISALTSLSCPGFFFLRPIKSWVKRSVFMLLAKNLIFFLDNYPS